MAYNKLKNDRNEVQFDKKKNQLLKKYKSQEVEDPKKFIFLYSTKCVTKNKLLMIE